MTASSPLSGPQKAALVMLALDESAAAEVVKHLDPAVLRALVESADKLDSAAAERFPEALEAFAAQMTQPVMAHDASGYIRRLAATSLGVDRAKSLLQAPAAGEPAPIDRLRGAKAPILADLLDEEHPQLAAVVIAQLPRAQAAKVLSALPESKQADVVARIGKLDSIPSETAALASQAIADALSSAGAASTAGEDREFDGIAFAAALLNDLNPESGKRILEDVASADEALAPKLREAMFTFEDLLRVDVRGLQQLMREVQSDRLLIALKTASKALRDHLLSAISQRAAASLREDLAALPPMKLADVEAAQREVVEIASRLGAEGRIVLPTGGDGGTV